jgi:hypothetical protein
VVFDELHRLGRVGNRRYFANEFAPLRDQRRFVIRLFRDDAYLILPIDGGGGGVRGRIRGNHRAMMMMMMMMFRFRRAAAAAAAARGVKTASATEQRSLTLAQSHQHLSLLSLFSLSRARARLMRVKVRQKLIPRRVLKKKFVFLERFPHERATRKERIRTENKYQSRCSFYFFLLQQQQQQQL